MSPTEPRQRPPAAVRDTATRLTPGLKALRSSLQTALARLRPAPHLLVLDLGPAGCLASLWRAAPARLQAVDAAPVWTLTLSDCEPESLLAEILPRLRTDGQPRPAGLLVCSGGVVQASVDLPADPLRPRPPLQMHEMARYEIEPALAAHNALWTIGEVLSARASLGVPQRAAVVQAMAQGGLDERGDPLRFGELALVHGGLSRSALDEALQAQQTLHVLDSDLACGWRGALLRSPQGQRAPHWQVVAMSQALRQRWRTAARGQGLALRGLWPRLGLAALSEGTLTGTTLVLELWPEQALAQRLVDGTVAAVRSEPRHDLPLDAGLLAGLLAEWQVEQVAEILLVVADPQVRHAELVPLLQRLTRTPVRVIAADPRQAALARARALMQALPQAPARRRPLAVPLRDPQLPVWQRPAWRPWLICGALLAGLLLWQGVQWAGILSMRREARQLEESLQRRAQGSQSEQQLSSEAQQLDAEAMHLRAELAGVMGRAAGMALVEQRRAMLPELMRALASAIDDRVVLDAVVESQDTDARLGIEVRAWSPDAARLQSYAARVAEAVAPLGLAVAQGEMQAGPGRLGTQGYRIRYWLVPEAAELAEPAEVGASAGGHPASTPVLPLSAARSAPAASR
ncbi:MAG: hypothetical protein RLY78_1501 [Pseudomonadota bacterium]